MFEENDELEIEPIEPEVNDELDVDAQIPEFEAEEDQEADQEQEPEDEKLEYSKRVNKRIDKLVYERNVAREELRKLHERLAAIEDARNQDHAERENRSFDEKKRALSARKREALEIGDYDEVMKIDNDLFDLIAEEKVSPKKQQQPAQQVEQQPAVQPEQPQLPANEALQEWQYRNQWVFDQGQKSRLTRANKVLQSMLDSGYDIEDPETYSELDKRLKREVPPPAGAPDRGRAAPPARPGMHITAEDKRRMKDWNLDPENAEHRKEWLKNKVAS